MNPSSRLGSTTHSSPSEFEEDGDSTTGNSNWRHMPPSIHTASPSVGGSSGSSSVATKSQLPLQKRRRVTRACDECRRKKIKCDGKQPCTHCTVYSYDCTYDQPSNRRRNPAPQYIEALEARLQRMGSLLKILLPDVDVDHPNFDLAKLLSQMQANAAGRATGREASSGSSRSPDADGFVAPPTPVEKDSLLESMVEAAGRLDIDESGHMDFHGHSSGVAFLAHLNNQFRDLLGDGNSARTLIKVRSAAAFPKVFDVPTSATNSPFDGQLPNTTMLPSREISKALVDACMDDACVLMRFVHRPTFDSMVDRIYDTDPNMYTDAEISYLPLLYLTLAVGCIFASDMGDWGVENPIAEGTKYFNIGRRMVEITDCRDIPSIQAVIMMVLFLQSSARMSTCYSFVGIALSASVRMGLHRSLPDTGFDPIERETRRRVFWTVKKMDTYVGALLGLPRGIADEDIDQDMPTDVDDECITIDAILPQPKGVLPVIVAANAHCRLLQIMAKMVKYVYPLKGVEASATGKQSNYSVSSSKLHEIEQDLLAWLENLPMQLRPGGDTPRELRKAQYLLKMAFSHVQMLLYRPFLHYVSRPKHQGCDERLYASGANCVNVARKIVHTARDMSNLGILNGAYWFTMYTCFFSVITLVYFVLENPDDTTSLAVLRDAETGRELLSSVKDLSLAAKRCSMALAALFEKLPESLKPNLEKANQVLKKKRARQTMTSSEGIPANWSSRESSIAVSLDGTEHQMRSRTIPPSPTEDSKRRSMTLPLHQGSIAQPRGHSATRRSSYELYPNSGFSSGVGTPDQQTMSYQSQLSGNGLSNLNSMMYPSPESLNYSYLQQSVSSKTPAPTYLETRQQPPNRIDQSPPPPENMFDPSASDNSGNPYDSLEVQLFGPLPPHLLQGHPQIQNGTSSGMGQNMQIESGDNGENPGMTPDFMGVGAGGGSISLDGFFGDEWDEILAHQE